MVIFLHKLRRYDLKIKMIQVSKLIPYLANAKKHSDRQICMIAASIKELSVQSRR